MRNNIIFTIGIVVMFLTGILIFPEDKLLWAMAVSAGILIGYSFSDN